MSATENLKPRITLCSHFDADSELHVLLECGAVGTLRPNLSLPHAEEFETRSDVSALSRVLTRESKCTRMFQNCSRRLRAPR